MRLHPLASHTESHLFLNSQSCWKRYHIYQEKLCHSCFFTLIIVLLIISGGSDVNNPIIPIILIPVYTPKWKCLGEADCLMLGENLSRLWPRLAVLKSENARGSRGEWGEVRGAAASPSSGEFHSHFRGKCRYFRREMFRFSSLFCSLSRRTMMRMHAYAYMLWCIHWNTCIYMHTNIRKYKYVHTYIDKCTNTISTTNSFTYSHNPYIWKHICVFTHTHTQNTPIHS